MWLLYSPSPCSRYCVSSTSKAAMAGCACVISTRAGAPVGQTSRSGLTDGGKHTFCGQTSPVSLPQNYGASHAARAGRDCVLPHYFANTVSCQEFGLLPNLSSGNWRLCVVLIRISHQEQVVRQLKGLVPFAFLFHELRVHISGPLFCGITDLPDFEFSLHRGIGSFRYTPHFLLRLVVSLSLCLMVVWTYRNFLYFTDSNLSTFSLASRF